MYISIFLCKYISIYLSIYLCMYMYLSIYVSIYLSIYLCLYLYIYISIYLSIYLSMYISVYLSIFLSIILSFYKCMFINIYRSMHPSLYVFTISIFLSIPSLSIYRAFVSNNASLHYSKTIWQLRQLGQKTFRTKEQKREIVTNDSVTHIPNTGTLPFYLLMRLSIYLSIFLFTKLNTLYLSFNLFICLCIKKIKKIS